MQTIAESLAQYAARLKFEDIPGDVIHCAKRILLDTLGCAFGGYDSENSMIARDLASMVTSKEPATVLCSGQKTSLDLAVFANDTMIRYLDYNDGYVSKGGGHPSDSIAPLLSAAEMKRADGRELLTSIVLTYEVFCQIADAWDNKKRGFDHTVIGGIASVVGSARTLRLSQEQIAEAINLMVASNISLNQIRVGNVSKWKGCAYANASRNAIFAAQLAARGMTGPSPIFEGRNGFFKVVSGEPFELAPFGGRDQPFRILQTHLKRFPLGNFSQTVVTAVLDARAQVANIEEIEEVQIRVSPKAINVMADSRDKWRPQNRETADHSIPYTAAVALLYGTIDESYFDEKYFLRNQELLAFVDRIKCSALAPSGQSGNEINEWNLCEVDIILRSGEHKSAKAEYHRGHWRNPMSDAEIEEKFRSLVGDMLPSAKVNALIDQIWKTDQLSEVSTLIQMTKLEPHLA